jgi:hypothetical protein
MRGHSGFKEIVRDIVRSGKRWSWDYAQAEGEVKKKKKMIRWGRSGRSYS